MFPESKVTEIYCMADDFCKEFTLQQEKYMIKDMKTMHRNKPNRMSDAEIMVILILFHSGGFRCFKHYYKEYVCKHLKHLFPRQVSYNRFVEENQNRYAILHKRTKTKKKDKPVNVELKIKLIDEDIFGGWGSMNDYKD